MQGEVKLSLEIASDTLLSSKSELLLNRQNQVI